jgi:predicted helicase
VPKDFRLRDQYEKGFKVDELFNQNVSGVESVRDSIAIQYSLKDIKMVISDFAKLDEKAIKIKYETGDARDWKVFRAKEDVISANQDYKYIEPILYRPFDSRFTFYTGKQNGFVCNGRYNVMKHMLDNNTCLIATQKNRQSSLGYFFVANNIVDRHILDTAGDSTSVFPLYLYDEQGNKTSNLNTEIVQAIKLKAPDCDELAVFDYIYGVLHWPAYRTKYKEFLKIDFPRVPYPANQAEFNKFRAVGEKLRGLHLMTDPGVNNFITTFPIADTNEVTKLKYEDGKVYINETQYFGDVPEVAWNFYIGGYQPAQKWLKDRKNRTLSFEDIEHYQKIIKVLSETSRVMEGM